MSFFQILANTITRYGFFDGIILFIKLKLKLFNNLKIPNIPQRVKLRKGTSDYEVFLQIFVNEEYGFNYKPEINTIIDAGANAGYASVYFSGLFKNAQIISIEPETGNFNLLKHNTCSTPNIKILLGALWNKNTGMQVKNNGGHWVYSVEENIQGKVKGYNVSDLLNTYQLDKIDILKIDVEGSEKEIFSENYSTWLPLTRYLIVETHDRIKKDCTKTVFDALSNYNFSCHINGENFIFVNEDLIDKNISE